MDYDLNWLEEQHRLYRFKQLSPLAQQYMIKPEEDIYEDPDAAYKALRNALKGLSEDARNDIIEQSIIKTKQDQSRFVKALFEENGITRNRYASLSGVSPETIKAVELGRRFLPKVQFFALCLFFKLEYDYVVRIANQLSIGLSSELIDVVFIAYIKDRKYALGSYVETVYEITQAIERLSGKKIELPNFFDQGYLNNTIDDYRALP